MRAVAAARARVSRRGASARRPSAASCSASSPSAMLADERRLAELCTRENGKPLKEAIAEVRYAASFLSWFAGEAERIYGETIPASHAGQRIVVDPRAGRPVRADHAVELPVRDADAQARRRARRRLHRRRQAGASRRRSARSRSRSSPSSVGVPAGRVQRRADRRRRARRRPAARARRRSARSASPARPRSAAASCATPPTT